MARPAYSTRFFTAAPLAGGVVSFGPVPVGFLWVIRDVYLFNTAQPPAISSEILVVGDAGQVIASLGQAAVIPQGSYHWEGRQVMEPGESADIITADFVHWSVTVSGYVLSIP